METLLTILNYLGYAATILVLVTTIIAVIAWFRGILPAILRLGNGLAKRKIAIFAKSDTLSSLTSLLTDSGLVLEKNVVPIAKEEDFGKAESATLFLVYWPDWKNKIIEIKNKKMDGEALVIYAPYAAGRIPDKVMAELDKGRNVTVVNFRGRLLNDIVTAMITTGYMKG